MNSTCNFYPTKAGQRLPCPHCGQPRDARFALCIQCNAALPESLRRSLASYWRDRNNPGMGYPYSRVIAECLAELRNQL